MTEYCELIYVTPTAPKGYAEVYDIACVDANGNEVSPIQCGGTPIYLVIFIRWQNTTTIRLKVTCGVEETGCTLIDTYVDLPQSSGDGAIFIGAGNQPFDPKVIIEPCCGSCDCDVFTICAEAIPA